MRYKEVLILCNDKEKVKEVIKNLAKEIKFITVYGFNEEEGEELYDYILDEIGLSIFHTKDFYNIIDNYDIIINFLDKINLKNVIKKKKSIVFDFTSNENRQYFIKDCGYDLKDLSISNTKWFNSIINTQIFKFLLENNKNNINPKYIITKSNNCYTIKEYIDLFIKIKGRF